MTITKQKKAEIISDLENNLGLSKSVIFLEFHGETVEKTRGVRKELRKKDAFYKVARKTLVGKAFQKYGFRGIVPDFKGEMALVFVFEDNIADVLKFISGFAKEGKILIVGGIYDNEFRNAPFMLAVSKIPPKEVLYCELMNTINAPLKQMVDVLTGGIVSLINILNQVAKKQ